MAVYACFNSGQECSSLSRLIVPATARDEVVGVITQQWPDIQKIQWMNPCARPMVQRDNKNQPPHRSGIAEGATLVAGGEGCRTVLIQDSTSSLMVKLMCPKMTIFQRKFLFRALDNNLRFREEAIVLANDSEYGLSGGVWSGEERALQLFVK